MSPSSTLFTLLVSSLLSLPFIVAGDNSFLYPYSTTQSFSESLSPNSTVCSGIFEGANTAFACNCVTVETHSGFQTCTPVDDDGANSFCGSDARKDTCYDAICPDGECEDDLEISGSTVLATDCLTGTSLGFSQLGQCGCYGDSTRHTRCTVDDPTTSSAVCVSEKLTWEDQSGGYSAFCDSEPLSTTSSTDTDTDSSDDNSATAEQDSTVEVVQVADGTDSDATADDTSSDGSDGSGKHHKSHHHH